MAAKPGNKWKSVSKSVIGVMATKIATENPEKQFDNLKAFLERTKKQMADLSNTQGTKEVLEEKILKTRAILITFESRKSQLDNVLENIQQQNENENDIFKNEWNSLEEQTKNILKELESVLEEWKEVNELSDKINNFLSQVDLRRGSCCALDSAIDITSRLQNLKEENVKGFSSFLQKLKNKVKNLSEKNNNQPDDDLKNLVADYEEKMSRKQTEIDESLKAFETKTQREKSFENLRENFKKDLDNSLEILKKIRNEECDTDELQTCLGLVKKLKSSKNDMQCQFEKIDEETKNLNVERYFHDFEHISQTWNTFCHELDSCQESLETQTSESRKVLYLLNSVQREIMKQENVHNELKTMSIVDKSQLQQTNNQIKNSLECLKDVYVTMESFTHQWEKLKKKGMSDDTIETRLQNTSEKMNSLQYEFQTLLEKSEEMLNTVDRVNEDCQKIKQNIGSVTSYLAKVRLSEEDTNSDIQAKLSKIDQKLLEPCWDLIENVESLNEVLPKTFTTHTEAKNLKVQLEESDKEFADVRSRLSTAMTMLDEFNDLCNKTNTDLNEIRNSMMPNVKKLIKLDEKIDGLNQCKIVEQKLKSIGQELKQISNIQTTLNLQMCRKPAKDVTNKWKELIQTCLENITELSREILKAQSKINKRSEFINWVQSTKESIEQIASDEYHFDKLNELELLQNELNELQLNLKEKHDESRELENDTEREELQQQLSIMSKRIGHSLESLSTINTFWNEYDQRVERLSSWLNLHLDKFNEIKLSEKLNEKLSNLKELLSDIQGKENKINDLNGDAQKLNLMINSYHILQQSCSLINLKSQLRDDIENEIQFVDKWLFVKSQLKSLNQQISSLCNKIASMTVSDDEIEDQINLIEEVQTLSVKFDEDLNKIKDNYDYEVWPKELLNEFASIDERFVKFKTEIKTKMIEIEKIMNDENEKRILSMARSHECTPTVYETVEEMPTDFEIHFMGGRKTSLKVKKFSKYRTRTNSNLFKRRSTKTLTPMRKHHQSEGDQEQNMVTVPSDHEGSASSSIDTEITLPEIIIADPDESSIDSSFDRESSTASSIPSITLNGQRSLWDRLRDLADRVRSIDLTMSDAASTTLKVLLVLVADARRLWLAHGDFDFYNFDEINLHQSIQFVQLDILQLIEDCYLTIDASSIVDNIFSHININY